MIPNLLNNSRRLTRGGLLASLALVLTGSGALIAQDNIVALGRISGAGALVNGTGSPSTVIVPVRNSAGDYTVTITSAGAYTGTDVNDYVVQAAIAASASGDELIRVNVSAVTANTITLEVNTDDLENNPSGAIGTDASFFFTIFRTQSTVVADNTTSYLLASGNVSAAGTLDSSIGRDGVTPTSSLNAVGDYTITLSAPGQFNADTSNDYVLALTLEGSGAAGYAIRGDVSSVATNGEVVFNVHSDDVQAAIAAADAVPASRAFYFTVFQTTAMPVGSVDTTTLTANARVDAAGTLLSSNNSYDGGTITSVRLATGSYRVTITSAGAFNARTVADYIAHATLNQPTWNDDGIMTEVVLVDANTLQINVSVTDVEEGGQAEGIATDAGFYLTVLDTVADPGVPGAPFTQYQPDLRIGRSPALGRMKGNNLYNSSGRGQAIRLPLENQKWSTYHFALENDGRLTDRIRIKEVSRRDNLRTKYFRLTGGRKNVTGLFIRSGLVEPSVRSGEVIRYQGWAKYLSNNREPQRVRILARSLNSPTKVDAVRVNTRPTR